MGDFTYRAEPSDVPELMDGPCSYDTLRACLRDLEKVNRLTLSYRPTLRFLARVTQPRRRFREPLHILDVGSGNGDTLRRIYRWAKLRRIVVTLTGIDLNPNAIRAAQEATAASRIPDSAISWITGNSFSAALPQAPDVILSSLLTHHLSHAEIVFFLRWMEQTARVAWFINDLERQPLPAKLFGLLARTLSWHAFVQHDGPVSFQRAFRTNDWQAMLVEAKISSARVHRVFPARLCVERRK